MRIVARKAGWKIERSSRFVIRRVLEGGAGVTRGGIVERSIERGLFGGRGEREGEDVVGEGDEWRLCGGVAMASIGSMYVEVFSAGGSGRLKLKRSWVQGIVGESVVLR